MLSSMWPILNQSKLKLYNSERDTTLVIWLILKFSQSEHILTEEFDFSLVQWVRGYSSVFRYHFWACKYSFLKQKKEEQIIQSKWQMQNIQSTDHSLELWEQPRLSFSAVRQIFLLHNVRFCSVKYRRCWILILGQGLRFE